jgi:hypothetical protein
METTVQKSSSTPRDVFLYLLAVGTLYFSVWRFIDLIFEYINHVFPDYATFQYAFSGFNTEIRLSIASLVVVFPVYVGITWFLRKDAIHFPEKREMKTRKWLLNFTLFLSAVMIISDLVTLVYNFLEGEVTVRFLLKVLVVLIVAGAVFGYYIWDLRRTTVPESKPSMWIAVSALVVVFSSMAAGFFIIGSPMTQRQAKLDNQRVSNLQTIQYEVINYWTMKRVLPPVMSALRNDISGFVPPVDPETGVAYEYLMTGSLKFELCANFALDSTGYAVDPTKVVAQRPYDSYGYPYSQNWEHPAGRKCFERQIDPQLYPVPTAIPVPKY